MGNELLKCLTLYVRIFKKRKTQLFVLEIFKQNKWYHNPPLYSTYQHFASLVSASPTFAGLFEANLRQQCHFTCKHFSISLK